VGGSGRLPGLGHRHGGEGVAAPGHVHDRAAGVAQQLAQGRDLHPQVRLDHHGMRPGPGHQRALAHDFAGPGGQQHQQVVGARAARQRASGAQQQALGRQQFEVEKGDPGGGGWAGIHGKPRVWWWRVGTYRDHCPPPARAGASIFLLSRALPASVRRTLAGRTIIWTG